MAITGVQVFERRLRVAVGDLTGSAAVAKLAAFARQELSEVIATGQGSPHYDKFVNGQPGVVEERVRLPGPIVYVFSWLDEVVELALESLRKESPIGPAERGHYMDSHEVLIGGQVVASSKNPGAVRSIEIPPRAEVVISNSMPYARKIEVGAMRKMSVPPRVYEQARQAVLRQYRRLVTCELRFITRSDGYQLRAALNKRRSRGTDGTVLTYPALVINLRD